MNNTITLRARENQDHQQRDIIALFTNNTSIFSSQF